MPQDPRLIFAAAARAAALTTAGPVAAQAGERRVLVIGEASLVRLATFLDPVPDRLRGED